MKSTDTPFSSLHRSASVIMAHLEMTESCLFKVANYGIGGHYEPHHDFVQVGPWSGINPHLIAFSLYENSAIDSCPPR